MRTKLYAAEGSQALVSDNAMNALEASVSPDYFTAQVKSDEEWRHNTSK